MSLYWMEIEISNSVGKLIVASPSPQMTNYPWKNIVRWLEPFKFGVTNYISGMAEARVVGFYM